MRLRATRGSTQTVATGTDIGIVTANATVTVGASAIEVVSRMVRVDGTARSRVVEVTIRSRPLTRADLRMTAIGIEGSAEEAVVTTIGATRIDEMIGSTHPVRATREGIRVDLCHLLCFVVRMLSQCFLVRFTYLDVMYLLRAVQATNAVRLMTWK